MSSNYEIPFTTYTLPHGRKSSDKFVTTITDVYNQALDIIEAGFHFEFEVLRTGDASFTIGDEDGDYAHLVILNKDHLQTVAKVEAWILDATVERLSAARKAYNE